MTQVMLTINGRSYPVACDEGQEERIRELGQYIDGKVVEFAREWGHIGDARLLLMASLVITDELAEASDLARKRKLGGGSGQDHDDAESVLAAGIESLAARIEAVAARLESTT